MTETYRQLATQQPVIQQQAPQQAPLSFQGAPQPPDPQLMYTDPATYQNQLFNYNNWQVQQQLSQAAQPLVSNMADMSKFASQSDPKFQKVWSRWGHEIEREIASLPAHMRNKQAYDMAASIVKGNHADELADERAREIAAQQGANLERAGANPGAPMPPSSPLEELWADDTNKWVRDAKAAGMTQDSVRDYCKKTGTDLTQYVADIKAGNVFTGAAK